MRARNLSNANSLSDFVPQAVSVRQIPNPLISHFSEAWMARHERNPVRARTNVRNRAGFPRERSHAALVDVSFGANSSERRLYFSSDSSLSRPHSKSLSSVRFKVLRHGRTSLWLAGFGFQAAGAADEQVLSGHRRGLLHNTHICRCLEAYSSRGAFFSELQSGQIQAACSSSSRRRFFISMMRQKL